MESIDPMPNSAPRIQPSALLELLKPITWFPPMWAFLCGAVSVGFNAESPAVTLVLGILLTGPLVCGASQVVNDWFDRHVDAINEPNRPIPSGRVPGKAGLYFAIIWSVLAGAWGFSLGLWVGYATLAGLALAWAYSAPPLRLKRNGWWGNAAVGISYEGLAWITGAAVFLGSTTPPWQVVVPAALYSLGAHGIMTLNDFKSIDGDRSMGLKSLPAMLGADSAARLACVVMLAPQIVIVALLSYWEAWVQLALVALLMAAQLAAMVRLLRDPRQYAPWYNGTGVTAYVAGMMATATAIQGQIL